MQLRGDRFHHFEKCLGNFHPLPDLVVQHRVLGCNGGLRRECLEQLLIVCGKGTGVLIEELKDSDDPVGGVLHRHAKNASCRVAGTFVNFAIKARIGVCVWNVDDLASKCYVSGDACAERNPDLSDSCALSHL